MRSKASFAFILATVALDALAFAVIMPVVPGLVMQIGHLHAGAASLWLGVIFSVFALCQFLCAPVAGPLSDRWGRRPVLLVSQAALAANALLWMFAPNLTTLIVLRVVAGALAGNVSAANAYIGDVTPPEGRARAFGLVGAMFGLGFVVGPGLGGWVGTYGLRLPFAVAAALTALNFTYGLFVLPESLPVERRRPFSWRRANALGSLRLFGENNRATRLGIAWCCAWMALGSQQSSFILANEMRFGWSIGTMGLVLAVGGLLQAFVQGVLLGRVTKLVGPQRTAAIGLAAATCGYALYALAGTPPVMLAGLVVLAFGAFGAPAIQSMLSVLAGPTRQGEVQGSLSSLQGLSMVVGPTSTGLLFAWATRPGGPVHLPGLPFAFSTVLCLVGFVAVAGGSSGQLRKPVGGVQAVTPGEGAA